MKIYFINFNEKKYKQYKTYEEALNELNKLIIEYPDSKVKIVLEEYCEFGYSDSCCKFYDLFLYENKEIKFNNYH
jgi:hypothetical protein